jgi:2-keto-4-pentenoate hydratase/2-oxohepta-3-ene-1,7-dioic acid hydratase in catechol pathway
MSAGMIQLVTYATPGGSTVGLTYQGRTHVSGRYTDMLQVLDDWDAANERLAGLGDKLAAREGVDASTLLAPLRPRQLYFAGVNYVDHVEEMKHTLGLQLDPDPKASGQEPWFCMKSVHSVAGPNAVIARPKDTTMLDWELELAVVIGKKVRDVAVDQALNCVAGYTIANDLSDRAFVARRDVADSSPFKWDWIGQKSFDGACPLGPAITPARFIGDVNNLSLKLWVNGELMQDSNTSRMIFNVADLVSALSHNITLHPGDVILTGTPSGVGMARKQFLKSGDVVRQAIENIGEFEFRIQ